MAAQPWAPSATCSISIVGGIHAPEFRTVGLPAMAYFNSGTLLIDVPAWTSGRVLARCIGKATERQDFFHLHDQSLINVTLAGEIAELHPVWNWQIVGGLPPVARSLPVAFHHFIAEKKPFRAEGQVLERRFRDAYRQFFGAFQPDWLELLPTPGPLGTRFDWRREWRRFWFYFRIRRNIVAYLKPFQDEWTVIRNPLP